MSQTPVGGIGPSSRKVTCSARSHLAISIQNVTFFMRSIAAPEAKGVLQDSSVGARSQDVAEEAKMWLQEQRSGCRSQHVVARANISLQEPRCGCSAGAIMWLQEPRCGCRSQDVAAGSNMELRCVGKNLLKVVSCAFVTSCLFSDSLSFGAAILLIFC